MLQAEGSRAVAALREVGVPEQAGGDGAIGAPGLAEFLEAFRGRTLAQALYFLDGSGKGEIADGPDVWAAECAEKINVCGPIADAFERGEHFFGGIIVEIVKTTKVEVAAGEGVGEESGVVSFLTAEADAQ